MSKTLTEIGKAAKAAAPVAAALSTDDKNRLLNEAADALVKNSDAILEANEKDLKQAKDNGMSDALLDRLALNKERIAGIAEGMRQVAALEDPIGEVTNMTKRPNGLLIGQKRVPLGVIGVIYEARPNVTADVFALTFKTGNTVILKGGKEAASTNEAIAGIINSVLHEAGLSEGMVQLLEDNSRETTNQMMKLNDYIDVLIPRGGKGLISAVVNNATIPVIETGTGNCHIYVDESADLDKAIDIIFNAKTQRIGVCNAMESLVVHEKVLDSLLPALEKKLDEKNVQIRADEESIAHFDHAIPASEEDFGTEYLDYILSVKTVKDLDEAIAHINRYSTHHSDAILTESYANAQTFLDQVDSAAVYVNASTRFTDGFEFGFGAEIGISTQKLHARGPMGLKALTCEKFIIYGNGQIRP